MKHSLSLNDGATIYEFDSEADYQGKTFISFHKQSKFKEQVKHQNLTCKSADWPQVATWLIECCQGVGGTSEPGDKPPF